VDWKYGLWQPAKFFPSFLGENAHVWVDYFDEVVGLAISENGDNHFHVFAKEAYGHIYADIVQWVLAHWGERPGGLRTDVPESLTAQRRALEQCGLVATGVAEVTRRYALTEMATSEPVLAEGFKLVDMATGGDWVGRAHLQANAFRNENPASELDLLTKRYVRTSPIYKPEFDLAIVEASGVYVAGCEAFIDYANRVAEVERVCTHTAYRRRGLAKAVIQACFHRLKQHGIPTAYITGISEIAISLYGKLQPAREIQRIGYALAQAA
jgi:ribosomal protein S18 acetylase RimI-like enzyme